MAGRISARRLGVEKRAQQGGTLCRMRERQAVPGMPENIELAGGQQAMQFRHDRYGNERAAIRMEQQSWALYFTETRREIGAHQDAKRVENRLARPLLLLGREPRPALGSERAVVKAIGHESIGPTLHPACVELLLPSLHALDGSAEMGAVADRQARNAIRPRDRRRQRHGSANRFADEMESTERGRICH